MQRLSTSVWGTIARTITTGTSIMMHIVTFVSCCFDCHHCCDQGENCPLIVDLIVIIIVVIVVVIQVHELQAAHQNLFIVVLITFVILSFWLSSRYRTAKVHIKIVIVIVSLIVIVIVIIIVANQVHQHQVSQRNYCFC